ncbi:hypothetical protein [Bradyrhizobium sp. 5.13L]
MNRPHPKHTPGPWHASPTHNGRAFDIGAANGANIALVSGPDENGAEEFEANARLIAAAPKMLAALQRIAELEPVEGKAAKNRGAMIHMRSIALAAIDLAKGSRQ